MEHDQKYNEATPNNSLKYLFLQIKHSMANM